MQVLALKLDGVKLIKIKRSFDGRGFFNESYNKDRYFSFGIDCDFVQDNHSFSKKKTIRGMHFQGLNNDKSVGQAKLISVVSGKILDVFVDIRIESSTFGVWDSVVLSEECQEQLFIPGGFAHGFSVLSDSAHVLYKVSSNYDENLEMGFRFDDPDINISWPFDDPIVSDKDSGAPFFKEIFLC